MQKRTAYDPLNAKESLRRIARKLIKDARYKF
jgi:hypothetical protein